jgi:hypothetical protein
LERAARAQDFGAKSLHRKVAALAQDGKLDDDFSLIVFSFN